MRTTPLVKQFLRIAALVLVPALVALGQMPMRPANWLDPDKTEPAGTHYRTFSSKLAGGEVSYLVYLPPSYEPQPAQRYPVVYWLHGLNGDQRGGEAFVQQLDARHPRGQGAGHDRRARQRHARQLLLRFEGRQMAHRERHHQRADPPHRQDLPHHHPPRNAGRRGLLDGRLRRSAPGVQVSRRVRNRGGDGRRTDRARAKKSSRAFSKRCSAATRTT